MRLVLIYDLPKKITPKNRNTYILNHRLESVHAIQAALEHLGHTVVPCLSDLNLEDNLREIKPQLAFNLSVRQHDENGAAYAPRILERMDIPFTGSPAAVCASAFDKAQSKATLQQAGIPTPKFRVIRHEADIGIPDELAFPLFVKPVRGGCSRGIRGENLIKDSTAYSRIIQRIFHRLGEPLLVAEFMPGREFSVGILESEKPKALPVIEFQYLKGKSKFPFRTFARKMIDYEDEAWSCPADLRKDDQEHLEKLAMAAFRCLGCRDYARVDIRLDGAGEPNVLDINVLPTLVPGESSFALMAQAAGISFEDLIHKLINLACRRSRIPCKE